MNRATRCSSSFTKPENAAPFAFRTSGTSLRTKDFSGSEDEQFVMLLITPSCKQVVSVSPRIESMCFLNSSKCSWPGPFPSWMFLVPVKHNAPTMSYLRLSSSSFTWLLWMIECFDNSGKFATSFLSWNCSTVGFCLGSTSSKKVSDPFKESRWISCYFIVSILSSSCVWLVCFLWFVYWSQHIASSSLLANPTLLLKAPLIDLAVDPYYCEFKQRSFAELFMDLRLSLKVNKSV